MQKNANTTNATIVNSWAISGVVFSILAQFKKGLIKTNRIKTPVITMLRMQYVVLTYILAKSFCPKASASANLLRNPLPNPISKKLNQAIIELRVSQIP